MAGRPEALSFFEDQTESSSCLNVQLHRRLCGCLHPVSSPCYSVVCRSESSSLNFWLRGCVYCITVLEVQFCHSLRCQPVGAIRMFNCM